MRHLGRTEEKLSSRWLSYRAVTCRAIRIAPISPMALPNRPWRIYSVWTTGGADRVEIVDYHRQIPNPTPGEVQLLEFIEPMGLTQSDLARAIAVPPRRINEIVLGKRSITADTDLRLARYFGVT
jgi:addiction module HigA family antidote